MTTFNYYERYMNGEYETVVQELMDLGPAVYDDKMLYKDARRVAKEIVARIRHNLKLIIPRLTAIGYEWECGPPHAAIGPISSKNYAQLLRIQEKHGRLPLFLDCFYDKIGEVNFMGKHPLLTKNPFQQQEPLLADPLVIIVEPYFFNTVEEDFFEEHSTPGEPFHMSLWLFPDADSKMGAGGDTICIDYPYPYFDTPLEQLEYPSLISYLRDSLAYGGFAGLKDYEPLSSAIREIVTRLTQDCLDF